MVVFKVAQTVGNGASFGLTVFAVVHLTMFLFRWFGERWDKHTARLAEREALADESIANRMRKLEAQQVTDANLITGLYRALNVLTAKVNELAPLDPALIEVREIIASALDSDQSQTPLDMIDLLRGAK